MERIDEKILPSYPSQSIAEGARRAEGSLMHFAQHFRFAWRKWKIIFVHFKSEVLYEFLAVRV